MGKPMVDEGKKVQGGPKNGVGFLASAGALPFLAAGLAGIVLGGTSALWWCRVLLRDEMRSDLRRELDELKASIILEVRSQCRVNLAEPAATCNQTQKVAADPSASDADFSKVAADPSPSDAEISEVAADPGPSDADFSKVTVAKSLPPLPRLAELKRRYTSMVDHEQDKFKLLNLAMKCQDSTDSGIDCKEAGSFCQEDSDSGWMARSFCPNSCKACVALDPAELTASSQQRAKLMKRLAHPLMTEASPPQISVKSTDKLLYVIVDNFLPASVVLQTARLARESLFWQPADNNHKRSWILGTKGGGTDSQKDANGLFAPGHKAGGFPGLQMPPNDRYTKLMWARLQSLDLPNLLQRVMPHESVDIQKARWRGMHQTVCQSPSSLHVDQTRPHVDKGQEPPSLAVVHFITNWTASQAVTSVKPTSGGTAFYGERLHDDQGFFGPDECASLQGGHGSIFCKGTLAFNCSHGTAPPDRCKGVQTTRRMGREQMYISNAVDDSGYTLLDIVEPKFNRVVIYSANQLHAAFIDDAALEALSCDPSKGRVVSSFFIR